MKEATVTLAIPTLNEECAIDACLDAVAAQTYDRIVEVLVVDGRSVDGTRARIRQHPGVRLLDNPRRIQAAALNVALAEAKGEVLVRVDAHCVIDREYVERCVDALAKTGAALVGGCQTPVGDRTARQRGILAALRAPLGAGPARFRGTDCAGWSDTVYLGAMRTEVARRVGGYDEGKLTNEDAELAVRLRREGGVWLDPSIRSSYEPRHSLRALGLQYYRYGKGRAGTMLAWPCSIRPRQVALPVLTLGLLTPWRKGVAAAYAGMVLAASLPVAKEDFRAGPTFVSAFPVMHLAWAAGFWVSLARRLGHCARVALR